MVIKKPARKRGKPKTKKKTHVYTVEEMDQNIDKKVRANLDALLFRQTPEDEIEEIEEETGEETEETETNELSEETENEATK